MRITVISDSHDNIWKLAQAMPYLAQSDAVIHCGDLVAPFMIKRLAAGVKEVPVHSVWGNNDGDKRLLTQFAEESGNITIHGDFAHLEIGGRSIAVTHYPDIAQALAASGQYDIVCYGHDHTAHEEQVGGTLLLNPGELMGMNGKSTLAQVDTVTLLVTWVELD
jgi:putative phosphoesterase